MVHFEERSAVQSPGGMVTSPHHLASQAGAEVLRSGGSAVDAAIATAAVLGVVYPHMTGMGGDAFWLIHDPVTGKVHYLNGGGRAAASADISYFQSRGMSEVPFRGILPATLTTPGAVSSWFAAHQAYGRLTMSQCLDAAIGYAHDGYPVSDRLAGWLQRVQADVQPLHGWASLFMPQAQLPVAGSKLSNPALARTLQAVAQDGAQAFYGGDTGQSLARLSQDNGGFFTLADLAAQQAQWGEPLSGTYRDLTLFETPAPTQGFTVLQMLKRGALPSLLLTLPAFIVGLGLSLAVSLLLVFVRESLIDRWGVVLSVASMSIPVTVYVIFGQYVAASLFNYFPAFGFNLEGFGTARFIALPVSIMVLSGLGADTRLYRAIFLEEIRADYIRTAHAKGASNARVLFKHVLKNGMISVITLVVASLPFLIMGTLVIESFFGVPGLGNMMTNAIVTSDFALIRADVYLGSLLFLFGLLLTDICYAAVDPRIRLQ